MDNITLDLGAEAVGAASASAATIIGRDGAERQTAEDLAHRLGDDQLRGAVRDLPARAADLPPRWRAGVSEPLTRADADRRGRCVARRRCGARPAARTPDGRFRRRRSTATRGGWRAALARAAGGHPFPLSEGFGAWRVVAHDRSWQVDLLPLGGESIEADLAPARPDDQRDRRSRSAAAAYVDPFGGLEDLARGGCGWCRREAFADDPLRTIRAGAARVRARVRGRAGRPRRPPGRARLRSSASRPSGSSPSSSGS